MPGKNQAQVNTPQQFMSGMAANLVQAFVASGLKLNSLRTHNLLRKEEWVLLDEAIVQVARERLIIVQDLIDLGLTRELGGMGVLIDEYERSGDMEPAQVDMSGATPTQEDQVPFDLIGVPVPVHHKDFRIDFRRLEASRKLGNTIDTTNAEVATRKVSESLEDMVFNGVNISVGGNTIWGLLNHPDVNTVNMQDWTPIANIDNIYEDFNGSIAALEAAGYYGPYNSYVSGDRAPAMRQIYNDGSGQSALARIRENLTQINDIKVADRLPNNTMVMFQTSRDVIDLPIGEDITNIEWQTMGYLMQHFKVLACMTVRVKSDMNGNSGVVVVSP